MYIISQRTLNGRLTREQQVNLRLSIWKWLSNIYKKQKTKKNGDLSRKGIQVSYGLLSRKFNITYSQARQTMDYFTTQKYLKKWTYNNQMGRFKTKGNYYQLNYFG